MSTWLETFRGVVHPWMCDQFGHLNVRFYAHLFDDAGFALEAYVVFPSVRTTHGENSGPRRIDLPAPGTNGATRVPTSWVKGSGLIHEFGHVIHRRAWDVRIPNTDDSLSGDGWSATSMEYPPMAFSEGWATFVTRATLDDVPASATRDHYGCADSFDTTTAAGCAATGPYDDGEWYARNVTLTLSDWMDHRNDETYANIDGEHFAAYSLRSIWLSLRGMWDVAAETERNNGLDLCDYADYYVEVRKTGNPDYLDLIGDLLQNNGIVCGHIPF